MSDRACVVLAVCTALGALVGVRFPLGAAAAIVVTSLVIRRPALLWVGSAVLASALCHRAEAGLRHVPTGPVAGIATLLADPVDGPFGLQAEVSLGGRHLMAQARGTAASALRPLLAGERVAMSGTVRAITPGSSDYLRRRHVAGRLTVVRAGESSSGSGVNRLANEIRRTLHRGTATLDDDERALTAGLVLGDDRAQSPEVREQFRDAGLSHLLAVSGQNVAFVLALSTPLLHRLRLGWRVPAALAVLFAFGVLTRWEPSVLRAEAMAAITLLGSLLGRPVPTMRALALAVTVLLLADPFLVDSPGFQLSVGACMGIACLARPLARRLPGPRPVAEILAITVAAQVGVTPVLVPLTGGIPLASLPANLLAVPAAGPAMVWGLVAGLPAGLIGGSFAAAVHIPTRALVGWVGWVAAVAANAPLPTLGLPALVALALATVIAAAAARRRR